MNVELRDVRVCGSPSPAARAEATPERPASYPAFFGDLAALVQDLLAEGGIGEGMAQSVAWQVAEHARRGWGGRNLYLNRRQAELFDDDRGAASQSDLFLQNLALATEYYLALSAVPTADARALGREVARQAQREWGTEMLYLGKGRVYDHERRAREIFARYSGRNAGELAREFGLTDRRIQQIYGEMRRRVLAERQLRLF